MFSRARAGSGELQPQLLHTRAGGWEVGVGSWTTVYRISLPPKAVNDDLRDPHGYESISPVPALCDGDLPLVDALLCEC